MTADKPEAGRMCKPWCDTFASVYPVKSYCSDECKSAGRPVNEKDKPEAGRTCANWKDCGKHSVSAREKLWCSFECRDAALNPAPRPVEQVHSSNCPEGYAGQVHDGKECCEPVEPVEPPRASRPVERCSCPEATRYKAALEQLSADVREVLTWDGHLPRPLLLGISHGHAKHIERIARRALALGGETET